MKTIVVATGNAGKAREFKEILKDYEVLTMKDAGVDPEIVEDGTTFSENAEIKARVVFDALMAKEDAIDFDYVLADDSGMEIDFFDKKPGIYSARWLGEDTTYDIKNGIVLRDMIDVPDEKRTARYVCAIVSVAKDGTCKGVLETAEGMIAHEPKGEGGFGYDPIFLMPGLGTFAEISSEAKHEVSHRGKALRAILKVLQETNEA